MTEREMGSGEEGKIIGKKGGLGLVRFESWGGDDKSVIMVKFGGYLRHFKLGRSKRRNK